jgi:glutaredoxin-like protein NrdH
VLIRVYSKPRCQQCTATKRWLTEHGIPFVVEDIREPGNLAAAQALGHTSAPVVVVGDESWSGFRPDKLGELVEQLKEAA